MPKTVYQLKIVLRGIKPPIWRRVLIPEDATIRTLHETVQVAMGWYNCHLHQFLIHGREYGISYEGGIGFHDHPDQVKLADFGFQPPETFEYIYDLGDNWEHFIRVEKALAFDPLQSYPVCLGGARSCPREDSGGPWRYMTLENKKQSPQSHGRDKEKVKLDIERINFLLRDLQSGWFRRFDETADPI